jgi:hypothetical protein
MYLFYYENTILLGRGKRFLEFFTRGVDYLSDSDEFASKFCIPGNY